MKTFLFAFLTLLLAACGRSPLLHHRNASDVRHGVVGHGDQKSAATCPLAFPSAGLCAAIHWDKQPTADEQAGASAFTLHFWKKGGSATGPYLDPQATVAVQPWMPEHGHGIRPNPQIHRRATGVYSTDDFYFSMPGKWDIRVQLKSEGKVIEQAIEQIQIR
jgi:hypothetical protein